MHAPSDVLRLVRSLAHHQPQQIAGKLVGPLRRRVTRHRLPKPELRCISSWTQPDHSVAFLDHAPWASRQRPSEGRFSFLHREADLGYPPAWREGPDDLLWRFHLHGFEFLSGLCRAERLELCENWAEAFPVPEQPAWHPYPTSLRITAWCKTGVGQAPPLARSLYAQAAYLARNVERSLGGNHLLENARALLFGGLCFERDRRAARWVNDGLEMLETELRAQVLPDGGHFERSPGYHARMLELVLDCLNVLSRRDGAATARSVLRDVADRMASFQRALTHPDGTIALLSDSSPEVAPSTASLLDYHHRLIGVEPTPCRSFPDTGYHVVQHRGYYLVLDAGPLGPRHLPAHGHADIFTYELSLDGRRYVVDTGVGTYQRGQLRTYVRGTSAHNTMVVDGVDQAEVWHRFRVSRRYPPAQVEWQSAGGAFRFRGVYDGYGRLIGDGLRHERRMEGDAKAGAVRVRDVVTGSGRHHAQSFIHLHPDVEVRANEKMVRLSRQAVQAALWVEEGELDVRTTPYCPDFGVQQPRKTLVLEARGEPPLRLSYRLARQSG